MEVIYEDNHIIAVDKTCREIVQGDKTGDKPLSEMLKAWLKKKYCKPGNVFVGVTHRLDRPVSGVVIFAKTSKALSRLNEMFRVGEVRKTYWAIVKNRPPQDEGELVDWLVRNEKQNKSYAYDTERPNAKKAILRYKLIAHSDHYYLLEIDLKTGRHHQIRCQLAKMGCPIIVPIRMEALACTHVVRSLSIRFQKRTCELSLPYRTIICGKRCRLINKIIDEDLVSVKSFRMEKAFHSKGFLFLSVDFPGWLWIYSPVGYALILV